MLDTTTSPRTLTLNMGPHHPSTHGVRLVLELDGEMVVKATPDIGYLHTGIEKSCEDKRYLEAITLMGRVDSPCPLTSGLCYVLAVEKLLGLEPPPRAVWLRVLLSEMTRIQSHLAWLGAQATGLGATSVFARCFREREEILNLLEMLSSERMATNYVRVGGVAAELPPELLPRAQKLLRDFPARISDYERSFTRNPIWIGRTTGVGVLRKEDALAFGVSGPAARASGIDWDLRRDMPYSGYDQFRFSVPVRQGGDVQARCEVRLEEMRQSVAIAQQAINGLPGGTVTAEGADVIFSDREQIEAGADDLDHNGKNATEEFRVPEAQFYQAVESPRGELGCYIVSDGRAHPYRLKVRAPSFANLQALPRIAEGRSLSDLIACLGSLDIVMGEVDR
jgi:NADH-quinone oxidoreductase subunit D